MVGEMIDDLKVVHPDKLTLLKVIHPDKLTLLKRFMTIIVCNCHDDDLLNNVRKLIRKYYDFVDLSSQTMKFELSQNGTRK